MERMENSLASVTRSFASLRTGRASPSMLDRVKVQFPGNQGYVTHDHDTVLRITCHLHLQVDYYGAPTPLKSLAGVSAPESTQLVVQPYDLSAMQLIEKAIMSSDLKLTPSNDGKLIRINIPALTAVSFQLNKPHVHQTPMGILSSDSATSTVSACVLVLPCIICVYDFFTHCVSCHSAC